MTDPVVTKLHEWLKAHEDDLLRDTTAILKIPSLESEAEPNAPFGPENRKALDLALRFASEAGMKTTDLEGYLGYADFGSGDRLILSLGHLDVVPTGPGWKHDPFGAEVEDGYIYSRGACDDKGPTMASFYAMRAIKECVPEIQARFRQAFGCNEESGFACVHRYMETEEAPTFGVAPDSGWPLYFAEKGIANLEIVVPKSQGAFQLDKIEGGQRPNIVIDHCVAEVIVADSIREEIEQNLADSWDQNLKFEWEGDRLKIVAIGKASHGAHPFGGDSAAIRILRFLNQIRPTDSETYFKELFESSHIGGAGLGIAGSDEVSRDLTCNLGIVKTQEDLIKLTYNVRYPVTWTGEKLSGMCKDFFAKTNSGLTLSEFSDSPPLYFPLDHPLVKTIVDVYREETGDMREPSTMGGGTYARAVPNTVSIGTSWTGDGFAHETDERLKVENLFKASRIYAHILYRLATAPLD
jgi:succinyl-diaminopimelate desuccinylase